MLLGPKRSVTYGPVRSRRLGASLGINALPPGLKVCTFDCLYCQYGWTDRALVDRLVTGRDASCAPGAGGDGGACFPSVDEVLEGVDEALARCSAPPAYLTFSGNGEPTLHPDFPALVDGVIRIRDRRAPTARTAVLSNSTRAGDAVVRDALRRLDVRIMKLDAGTPATFERYNRPVEEASLDAIVEALRCLGSVTIQSLFAGGPAGNASPAEVGAWVERVGEVAPLEVQLYTLDRAWPSALIERLDDADLAAIRSALASRGIAARIF